MSNEDHQVSIIESFSLDKLRDPGEGRAEFAKVVETYSGVIYRLALKMLENQQDAEDVLQETFIKAFRGLGSFDGRSSLSTWLYRIATNETLMVLRRRKNLPVSVSIDEPLDENEEIPEPRQIADWCCLPEDELMSNETRLQLEKAIESLPANLRIVFVLRDLEGLSTLETAEVLNLSETAVKTRLSRARFYLREQLSDYFSSYMARREAAREGSV
jgi:RNA polymerase sigma-70 factor, ECF subfamily